MPLRRDRFRFRRRARPRFYLLNLPVIQVPVLPTSGVTMGILGLAALKWEKWAKWMMPLLVLWILFAALTLIPPVLMKWGPA